MSQYNYTEKPNWYPASDVDANAKGWVYSPTGEVLVACRGLASKNTDALAIPTWALTLPANGTYAATDILSFTLVPSEAVFVYGAPSIALTIGAATRQAVFDADLSTPTALVFSYEVVEADVDANGIAVANTLSKNDGHLYEVIGDGQVEITGAITYTVGVTTGILVQGV